MSEREGGKEGRRERERETIGTVGLCKEEGHKTQLHCVSLRLKPERPKYPSTRERVPVHYPLLLLILPYHRNRKNEICQISDVIRVEGLEYKHCISE